MQILVCGSRSWTDYTLISDTIAALDPSTTIIEGCARGADSIAGSLADTYMLHHVRVPADWAHDGPRADFLRNIRMLEMLHAGRDLVVAFWDGTSRGTAHTIREAGRRGIPVKIIKPGDPPPIIR